MKPSLKIPFTITVVAFMAGLAIMVNRGARSVALPANFFPIWLGATGIMITITVWSWLRNKKK